LIINGFEACRWYQSVGSDMRAMSGVSKNRHGVYYVRKKVPKWLEQATAEVLGNGKSRQVFLKRSLNTKDLRKANVRAKPILIEFDRILAQAEALTVQRPMRAKLEKREIEQITSYFFAHQLAIDDEDRREGGSEQLFQSVAQQLTAAGVEYTTAYQVGDPPKVGLSDREMQKRAETLAWTLQPAKQALARGDYSFLQWEIDELLKVFRTNLDPKSASYRELGLAMLRAYVKSIESIAKRDKGEVVETPELVEPRQPSPSASGTLSAAYEGWKKSAAPSTHTLWRFKYAVDRFTELHGDLPVARIKRPHVLRFREALQERPVRRSGSLRTATLPELVEWSKKHTSIQRISAETVNVMLGSAQAVCVWAQNNGLIPQDVPWSDPFSRMRLPIRGFKREPWALEELRTLFSSTIFTQGHRPVSGKGEAAFWLPLMALFTGARLNELAPLTAADVITDAATDIVAINIRKDREQGRGLKTAGSARLVPIHPELTRIGFLKFVDWIRLSGHDARLFPLLVPGRKGSFGEAWAKWFGDYKRRLGIKNKSSVFHSFRHGFKDAARAGRLSEELHGALTGHTGSSVGRTHGAKDMVRRFGLETLADAVNKIKYPGLELSNVLWSIPATEAAAAGGL
jgi:integrase